VFKKQFYKLVSCSAFCLKQYMYLILFICIFEHLSFQLFKLINCKLLQKPNIQSYQSTMLIGILNWTLFVLKNVDWLIKKFQFSFPTNQRKEDFEKKSLAGKNRYVNSNFFSEWKFVLRNSSYFNFKKINK